MKISVYKMEATESPLDVLSRAATMLQENQEVVSNTDDAPKDCSNKQLPTSKWKRDRRNRLPEYSRTERNNGETSSTNGDHQSSSSPERSICSTNGLQSKETPLDMSVRQRGLPPSYAQTVNNPRYRSNYKTPTIVNGPPTPVPREEIPAGVNQINGISMCDPIIDEHFRRSLGENYQTLFMNNNISKDTIQSKTLSIQRTQAPTSRHVNLGDLMDDTGMSVDDHFAKALGDTWVKLNNKKQKEIKNNSNENQNLLSI